MKIIGGSFGNFRIVFLSKANLSFGQYKIPLTDFRSVKRISTDNQTRTRSSMERGLFGYMIGGVLGGLLGARSGQAAEKDVVFSVKTVDGRTLMISGAMHDYLTFKNIEYFNETPEIKEDPYLKLTYLQSKAMEMDKRNRQRNENFRQARADFRQEFAKKWLK